MNYNYGPYPGVIPVNMMMTQPIMSGQHVMTTIPGTAMSMQGPNAMYPMGYAASIRSLAPTAPVMLNQHAMEDNTIKSTTTVFVGNILERAPDMMIKIMLQKCGNVVSWKRVQGPTGKLPAFGFCEYDKPESTLRCLRLLNNFSIGEQKLLVKVDQKTTVLLEDYKRKCVELRAAAVSGEPAATTDAAATSDEKTKNQDHASEGDSKDGPEYDEKQYMDARTKSEDQKVVAALKSVLREYAKEISAPKEEKMKSDSRHDGPKAPSFGNDHDTLRTDGSIMDDDRKHLVNESIKQFREQFKDEDEKMRITELERNLRIADEMNRVGSHGGLSSSRLIGRSGARSPIGYKRAASPSLSARRSHRDDQSFGGTGGDPDDEDVREKRRQDRRYREREIQYQARLESWQDRERKRQTYYTMEREKEVTRRNELRRAGHRVLDFLKEYDDDVMDSKYYKGTALAQRLKEREREIALDDRDRQRERADVIEIRRKLLINNSKENVDELLKKYLAEELHRVTSTADRLVFNEQSPVREPHENIPKSDTGALAKPEGIKSRSSSAVRESRGVKKKENDTRKSYSPDNESGEISSRGDKTQPMNDEENVVPWTAVEAGRQERMSSFESVPLPIGNVTCPSPVRSPTHVQEACDSPSLNITVHTPVTINPLKVTNKRKPLTGAASQVFRDEDDLENNGYLSSDSQGGVPRSPSHRRKMLLRPLLLDKPPVDAEDRKRAIKMLIDYIPMVRSELFAYPIDWSQLDQQMMNARIKPWINKKIMEYIGEEESTLTEFICQKVGRNVGPEEILEDVRMVLDDEAEVFVVKMWRLIVYETEAKRNGVTGNLPVSGR